MRQLGQAILGGGIAVVVIDEQDEVDLSLERWELLAERVLGSCGVARGEVHLTFVESSRMKQLNSQHMGRNYPTDVLAFPMDGLESGLEAGLDVGLRSDDRENGGGFENGRGSESGGGYENGRGWENDRNSETEELVDPSGVKFLGDVVVCAATAKSQASTHKGVGQHDGSLEFEISALIVHGLLHLLGYDHYDEATSSCMKEREIALMGEHYRP